jgi:hypothetical protein
VLSRYSSFIAVLPPFIMLLAWEYFTAQDARKQVKEKICFMTFGFIVPLLIFSAYLFINSALDDFFLQNQVLVRRIGDGNNVEIYLNFVASVFQIVPSLASDFRGKLFTLILVICLVILVRELFRKISGGFKTSEYANYNIITVCLIAACGYLSSIHVYETFRLVNGASLGVGICVLVAYNYFTRKVKPWKYFMVFMFVVLCLFLSSSLFFKPTTSSYYPWNRDVLFREGVTNKRIGIFKSKILTKEYNDFYQEIYDTIEPFKKNCYILNYTRDVVAFAINDLPRVQMSSVHIPGIDDISKQEKIINQNRAVILTFKKVAFPGYVLIFAKKWPEEIPWLGGGYLFIYAPQRYINGSKDLSDKVGH